MTTELPKTIVFLYPPYQAEGEQPNLPTFSPKCQIIYSFLQMVGLIDSPQIQLVFSKQRNISPTADFPFIAVGNEQMYTTVSEILDFFAQYGYHLDYWTSAQKEMIAMWMLLIQNTLDPIWETLLYVDELNFKTVTSQIQQTHKINDFFQTTPREAVLESIPKRNLTKARTEVIKFLTLLEDTLPIPSDQLDTRSPTWFFKEQACCLDVLIYGYLASFYFIKFPNGGFSDMLRTRFPKLALNVRSFYDNVKNNTSFQATEDKIKKMNPTEQGDKSEEAPVESNSWNQKVVIGTGLALFAGLTLLKSYSGK